MVKNKNNIFCSFLFLYFFSFALSNLKDDIPSPDEWIIWNYKENKVSYHKESEALKKSYGVDFDKGYDGVDLFIKIEVTPDNSNEPTPLLCYSTRDVSCTKKEQLVNNPNGNSAILWIPKEEFKNEELIVSVETTKSSINYVLTFQGYDNPIFPPNFVYSYIVGKYTRDLELIIMGLKNSQHVSLGLDGSDCSIKVSGNTDYLYEYNHGKVIIYTASEEQEGQPFNKTIYIKDAKEGEYITISMHTITIDEEKIGYTETNFLVPNGPKIQGYVNKQDMTEECFPIDFSKFSVSNQIYVEGRITSKYAWMYLANENKYWIDDYDFESLDGHISIAIQFSEQNKTSLRYLCFELPFEEKLNLDELAYSFSLKDPKIDNLYKFYEPQMIGEIYRYMIPKGSIAFFHGLKTDPAAKKYDFSLYTRKGITEVYIDKCKSFPNCTYDDQSLSQLLHVTKLNQMAIWTTLINDYDIYGPEKNVIVVKCLDDDYLNMGYCEVESSIISKGQDIYLVEDEKFSKMLIRGENGNILTDLKSKRQISRLTIDIMVFNGDIKFKLTEKEGRGGSYKINEYNLANKIFYHIKINKKGTEEFYVEYQALKASFFTIKYSVHTYNKEQLEETVTSGESYLVNIDPTLSSKSKVVNLENLRYKNKNPYLANFFALNCEFEVKYEDKIIPFFDGYAQQILKVKEGGEEEEDPDKFQFNIKILNVDSANYVNKMCMIYVSGYEIEKQYLREILVPQNVNQQIIFKNEQNFNTIRFIYPHSNFTQDLSIFFNVIDKAIYNVKVYILDKEVKNEDVSSSKILFLDSKEFVVPSYSLPTCPVTLELSYKTKIIETDPMIEITFKQPDNIPVYVQKGLAKRDYVSGDHIYYLYTELGKNEVGDISLNFLREYGNLWGKVVRKDFVDKDPDWRGQYRMPSEDWHDSLPYDEYTKRLSISVSDTADCLEGCYLLLSIRINQIGEYVSNDKFYLFSLITKLSPSSSSYIEVPKVIIQVDEYVVGNAKISPDDKIYEFYEIWFPHDSEVIDFDWQSSVAGLYINLGGVRPTTKNSDFQLLPGGKHSILTLSKESILTKAKEKSIDIPHPDSIEDLNIVIGIWTDKSDSIDSELYSLRIHQSSLEKEGQSKELEIIEVKTDQKILCRPRTYEENNYRCLFMIPYDDTDIKLSTPILAFAHSVNPGAIDHMYANYINPTIYEKYQVEELRRAIPNDQNADISTYQTGNEYIYQEYLKEKKYLFLSVVSDCQDDIMLVTSMPVYNHFSYNLYQFYPNPNTEQVLAVHEMALNITFPGTDTISMSIVTLAGNGQVWWQRDPFKIFDLRGEGDRITMISGKTKDSLTIVNSDYQEGKTDYQKYVFYISFHKRKANLNFDEIKYGKSLELSYKETNLPVVLYNKIGSRYNDLSVSITFKDNEVDTKREMEFSPLYVESQIVKEKSIYVAKNDPSLCPPVEKSLISTFDISLKTAQVFISHQDIEKFHISEEDNPTLYLKISPNFQEEIYEKFSIEAQIIGLNDGVIPVEKVYHYASARNIDFEQNIHRLKPNQNRTYMRVHLAFNSEQLSYAISTNEERKNVTFLSTDIINGKIIITFKTIPTQKIYNLIIFKTAGSGNDPELNDYTFKYMNAEKLEDFFDYAIQGTSEIVCKFTTSEFCDNNITCSFDQLNIDYDKVNVTYYLKIYPITSYVEGENYKTISISNKHFHYSYERNPMAEFGKIKLSACPMDLEWGVINVIAQVQEKSIIEYVSYDPIFNKKPIPDKTDGEKSDDNDEEEGFDSTILIVIAVVILVIIIALVVLIFYFHRKNQAILNKVKNISFTGKTKNADPNALLLN